MPSSLSISINLGSDLPGLTLLAQLIRADGTAITSFISDGFYEIGDGYYLWDYTNFPDNLRGGVKFYSAADTSKVLAFVDLNLTTAPICTDDCIGETGDTFDITYDDQTGLSLYALLFSAEDSSKAWNPSTSAFETYELSSQSSFVLTLIEDTNRLGWYKYSISDVANIPIVVGNQYYFVEVWKMVGDEPNRAEDCKTGSSRVFWGKETGQFLEIAKKVWEYNTRTLTVSPITAREIWEYTSRTLTANGVVDCDFTTLQQTILAAIALSTGKTLDELSKVNQELGDSIQKTFELLQACCTSKTRTVPLAQTPKFGSLTEQTPPSQSGITFGR